MHLLDIPQWVPVTLRVEDTHRFTCRSDMRSKMYHTIVNECMHFLVTINHKQYSEDPFVPNCKLILLNAH